MSCAKAPCAAQTSSYKGTPQGTWEQGGSKSPDLGRARKTMLLFWINVHLSQNWHSFYLIKPITKEWPLSTQACQTLDSHTFLKGWAISSLGLTLTSASADPLTFSSTFLLMSSNLYHIQDNALGMPTDLSALLMAASFFGEVKMCRSPSRYLFAPNALRSQCIYKNSAVLMMAAVGRRQRMAGKGASCDL